MAGLLSGLKAFGLGGLEDADIFEQKTVQADPIEEKEKPKDPLQLELELLFDKSFTCPVCDNKFKQKSVRSGKAKLIGTDMDLRPRYEHVDTQKYDVILCPKCGYAALSRYFTYMTPGQAKLIREHISAAFKPRENKEEVYSYETALERYKLALATAIVRKSKASEKAYICLKAGWLLRGMTESLDPKAEDHDRRKAELTAEEDEFLKNAFEGFLSARQNEGYPMCGMEQDTVDYLIAVLALRFEKYDISGKLIAGILASPNAPKRMKDKARDIKEIILYKVRETKEKQ